MLIINLQNNTILKSSRKNILTSEYVKSRYHAANMYVLWVEVFLYHGQLQINAHVKKSVKNFKKMLGAVFIKKW